MPHSIDHQQLRHDWNELQDPERAVANAREFLEAIRDRQCDPVPLLPEIELAAEPLWDALGGDARLVVEALASAEPAFRAAESEVQLTSPDRLYLRSRLQVLIARAWYRYPHERQAFVLALAALRWLEDFVGGGIALEDVISRPANPVAEQAVAVLGIYPAALRRSGLPEVHLAQFRGRGLKLVEAYLRRDCGGVLATYDRTHALASQWFYLTVHECDDDDLVKELYELDLATRSEDLRGQATREPRDMEFERRFGDAQAAERHRLAAIADLARCRLVRHQRMVAQFGYLAAA